MSESAHELAGWQSKAAATQLDVCSLRADASRGCPRGPLSTRSPPTGRCRAAATSKQRQTSTEICSVSSSLMIFNFAWRLLSSGCLFHSPLAASSHALDSLNSRFCSLFVRDSSASSRLARGESQLGTRGRFAPSRQHTFTPISLRQFHCSRSWKSQNC